MTNPTRRQALCCECGAIREVSPKIARYDRRLRCAACGVTTQHAMVGIDPDEDWMEHVNYHPFPKYPGPTEEEEIEKLLYALEHHGYEACDFETEEERAERVARTKRHGEARNQEFLELHRQGYSYDQIAHVTDWNRETVRKTLHKLGVHRFNSSLRKPGLTT